MVVARTEEAYDGLQRARQAPRARAGVPRARPRPAALAARPDRGADRPRPPRPDPPSLDTDTPKDAVTHFEVVELLPATRCSASGSRPAARTRSACTSRRSACRSPAIRLRGARARARAAIPARREARVLPSGHGPAHRVQSPLPLDLAAEWWRAFCRPELPRSRFRSHRPGGRPGGWCRSQCRIFESVEPSEARRLQRAPQTEGGSTRVRRLHEGASGGRGPLRPPDPPLEPEDAQVHLHRAWRHLHHRPPADRRAARGGYEFARNLANAAANCCSSGRRSRRRTPSRSRRSVSGCRT